MTHTPRTRLRAFALTAVLALISLIGLMAVTATTAAAAGTTRYVATTGDDTENDCTDHANPCKTIQHAVDEADSGDTVSVAGGNYSEAVHIRISLTLSGAGSSGSGRTTISGPADGNDPSIYIDGIDSDGVPEVTVENVDVSGNSDNDGIRIDEAIAHVNASVVSDNSEDGVILGQSSINADAQVKPAVTVVVPSVTLSNDTIDGNGSDDNGSGVTVDDGQADIDHSSISGNGQGGIVVEGGTAHVDTSTLDKNVGAAFVLDSPGVVGSLTNSTASNTTPFTSSEGPAFGGGVLVFFGGTMNIDTSTIANNTGQGVFSQAGFVHVNNSTISGTKPPVDESESGGVVVDNVVPEARTASANRFGKAAGSTGRAAKVTPNAAIAPSTALRGTIDADNTTVDDCNGPVDDAGYNLSSDGSCDFTAAGSIQGGHARLNALSDNGGPTQTMKPKKTSDALDKIPTGSAGCDAQGTDQRGEPRLEGPKCDIGAVEVTQTPVLITPNALPDGTVGTTYHQVIHMSGGLGSPYLLSIVSGSLPPGLTLGDDASIGGVPTQAGTYHFTVSVDDPTLKNYTIVILAAATEPLANTGPNVRPYAYLGATAVGLGLLMLAGSGALGRWYRRYIRQH